MAANAGTTAHSYFPLAQEREFFKYLPHDTSPGSSFNFVHWQHECQPSRDTALVSFAQLGAFRLGAQRALISLFDRAYQHVLAEATPTLSLIGGHVRDDRDLLRLGCCSFPKDRGLCHLVSSLPSLECKDRWVMNGAAVVVPDVTEDWFESGQLLNELSDVRFYAAVPIISPRGFAIGAYSICDATPRPEGIDEHSLQFLKDMASTVMGHLVTEREYHNSQQAERMIVGLGSFVEGRATLRHSWREASAQYAASEQSGETVEGQLNMRQQNLQEAAKGTDQKTFTYRDPRREGDGAFAMNNQETVRRSNGGGPDQSSQKPKPARGVIAGDETPEEVVLSTSIKHVFSRAANLIRESIGAEGVVFLDPNSERFGDLVYDTSRKVTGSGKDTGSSDEETDSGSSSSSRRQPSSTSDEDGEPHGPSACVCLGSSTSRVSSINSNSTVGSGIAAKKSLLTSLLRRYPRGKIFSYNANRAVSDDSDCISQATSGSEKSGTEGSAGRTKKQKRRPGSKRRRKPTFLQDAEHLINIFPDARNIMVLPVWDTDKNRCFAVNLVWTNSPERVFTTENELSYISVFANSIMTEIRRLDAKVADKAKTNLVSSITHELRNPLHGILGTSDILSDTAMNALQHGMVHTIEACGRTLLDTINNLLDFTFIDKYQKKRSPFGARQREKPLYADVQLDQVLEEVTECVFAGYSFYNHPQTPPPALTDSSSRAAGDAPSKCAGPGSNRVTIIFDIDQDSEWGFYTHAGAWRRILMNTFGNALKYTPSGFIHIRLTSSRREKKKKKRLVSDSEDEAEEYEVTLTVKDTGKGIGPEYLQKDLFTPFRQENALASGSGLGLSIVRQAVGSLGGSIEVNSTQGAGTMMTIRTPLTHHPAPSDASVFKLLRSHVEGKSMGLLGFGSSLRSKRDSTLCSSLERLCREWFGLSVTTVSPVQGEHQPFDFYLAVQTELDNEDREGRNLFNLGQHLAGDNVDKGCGFPVVVICQSPEEAHNMFIAAKSRGNESPIFEFISQPCGPRKLASALDLCIKRRLEQQEGQSSNPEEPTRWVEMPESSHLPLNLNPSDPPDERMRISKRPTTDTMGDGSRSRSGTDPSSAGKDDAEERTTGKSVLLVDDNDLNLQLLSVYTKKSGYDYLTAKNGFEAVETYKAQPGRFGVVLIDLSMPVMDGFEAARRMRRIEKQYKNKSQSEPIRPMIIAALTGLDSADAQKEAFGSGIDTFLIKPVKRPELQELLRQMDVP
ncbi:putative sensor histidine kinase/response regulator, partial [Aspergillus glaucus CBS 516.65]